MARSERLLGDGDAELLEVEDHCARLIGRQRTAPCTAGIGLRSIMQAMAWRWTWLSLDGWAPDNQKPDLADCRRISAVAPWRRSFGFLANRATHQNRGAWDQGRRD